MSKSKILANRFREVVLSGTLVANTNYRNQLNNISFKTATTKVFNLNTIAILAQHIHYYIHGVKDVFEGKPLTINDKHSFNFPEIESEQAWKHFLNVFISDSKSLVSLIENFPEHRLNDIFEKEIYGSYEQNINLMIEHCYYHLGQLVLIRKLIPQH